MQIKRRKRKGEAGAEERGKSKQMGYAVQVQTCKLISLLGVGIPFSSNWPPIYLTVVLLTDLLTVQCMLKIDKLNKLHVFSFLYS